MSKPTEREINSRLISFDTAANIVSIGSHEYACHVHRQYSIATAAHGGFLIALVWRAIEAHFAQDGTLARYNQPRTIALHIEFLRPTAVGDVTITIKDVRLGKGTSTVHASLSQKGSERCVVYATNAGLASTRNTVSLPMISLRPNFHLPPIDFDAVLNARDENWIRYDVFHSDPSIPSAAISNFIFALRRNPSFARNVTEYWITPRLPSNRWTAPMLGILLDLAMSPPENFFEDTQHGYHRSVERTVRNEREGKSSYDHPLWLGPRYYPTVNMSIEVKRQLPAEGVNWLGLRTEAKEVVEGRWDMDAVCWNEQGEVVAIARSLHLLVDFRRSTWGKVSKEGKGSKI